MHSRVGCAMHINSEGEEFDKLCVLGFHTCRWDGLLPTIRAITPARARVQDPLRGGWIPAFAGMTESGTRCLFSFC